MKISIAYNNISPSNPLRIFVEQRIGGLEKLLGEGPIEARVEIGQPSKHHRSGRIYYAEVNLRLGGKLFRAACQHENLRNAIVDVKNELQRQLKKFKDKRKDSARQPRK